MPSSEGNENSQKKSEGLISQKKLCKCRTLFFLLEKNNNNFAHFFWYISCIEGRVRQPGTSGFCYRASEFCYNLSDGQVKFSEESKLKRNCEINLLIKTFLGLVEMMFGLVNVSFSLPEWQAVNVTFFAPCIVLRNYNMASINFLVTCFIQEMLYVFLFTFFFASTHFHLGGRSHQHFSLSYCHYKIFMLLLRRNWSPLFFISRSSSFSVIQVNVKINLKERIGFLVVVFSLKVWVAMRFITEKCRSLKCKISIRLT